MTEPTTPTPAPCYRYRAELERVVDGDTYDLRIDLGFGVWTIERVRLRGIDTPEMTGATRTKGIAARWFAEDRLRDAAAILVETYKLPDGQRDVKTLGRYVADVWVDGVLLSQLLRDAGHVADVERLG